MTIGELIDKYSEDRDAEIIVSAFYDEAVCGKQWLRVNDSMLLEGHLTRDGQPRVYLYVPHNC